MDYYSANFRAPWRDMDKEIQQLVITHIREPAFERPLIKFLRNRALSDRKLFDYLLEKVSSGSPISEVDAWYQVIFTSDVPETEERIFSLQPQLSNRQMFTLLDAMTKRKYKNTLRHIKLYCRNLPVDDHPGMLTLILQINSQEAADLITDMLKTYKVENPTPGHIRATASALRDLSRLNGKLKLDFPKILHAIAYKTDNLVASAYIELVRFKHPEEAVPDMLHYLHNKDLRNDAFIAIMSFLNLDIWKRAREEIQKAYDNGEIDYKYFDYATSDIDNRTTHFSEHKAAALAQQRRETLQEKATEVEDRYFGENKQKTITSADHAEKYLDELSILYAQSSDSLTPDFLSHKITSGLGYLGNYFRFEKKDPGNAIKYYQKSIDFNTRYKLSGEIYPALQIAETYQLDLNDTQNAIKWYEFALAAIPDSTLMREMGPVAIWSGSWINHELQYLRTGKIPNITLETQQLDTFGAILIFSPSLNWSQSLQPEETAALPSSKKFYPHSHFSFFYLAQRASNLPAPEILAQIATVDPSHFWQANFFGLIGQIEKDQSKGDPYRSLISENHKQAKTLFLKSSAISYKTQPRQQFSTPEKTFQVFITALKEKNREMFLSCFSPTSVGKFARLFSDLTSENMAKAGESFVLGHMNSGFGEFREYDIIDRSHHSGGAIQFVFLNGEWLIIDM